MDGSTFFVDPGVTLQSATRWLQAIEARPWESRDGRLAAVCLRAVHCGGAVADPEAIRWLIEIQRCSRWPSERAFALVLLARLA